MLTDVAIIHVFSWLYNVPLYSFVVDICFVFTFSLLQAMLFLYIAVKCFFRPLSYRTGRQ